MGVDGGVSPSGPPPWEEEVVPPEDDVVEDSLDERRRLLPAFDFDSGVGLGSFLTSKTDRLIVLLVPRLPDVFADDD